MSNGEHWDEAAPQPGQNELSIFTPIRGIAVPVPHESRRLGSTATYSWIQEPDGNWLNKTRGPDGRMAGFRPYRSVALERRLEVAAQTIANWCREKTFASFQTAPLAITLEHSDEFWTPTTPVNSFEESKPPRVSSQATEPAVLVVGASRIQPRLHDARYIFEDTPHLPQARDTVPTQPGSLYATDARRGLMEPPVLPHNYVPFRRSFVRALVSKAAIQSTVS